MQRFANELFGSFHQSPPDVLSSIEDDEQSPSTPEAEHVTVLLGKFGEVQIGMRGQEGVVPYEGKTPGTWGKVAVPPPKVQQETCETSHGHGNRKLNGDVLSQHHLDFFFLGGGWVALN